MAVTLRLRRIGSKNDPFYRIVVADERSPRDGRFIEELGWYDPKKSKYDFVVDKERVNYWISQGAMVSVTVKSILKRSEKSPEAREKELKRSEAKKEKLAKAKQSEVKKTETKEAEPKEAEIKEEVKEESK